MQMTSGSFHGPGGGSRIEGCDIFAPDPLLQALAPRRLRLVLDLAGIFPAIALSARHLTCVFECPFL